MPTPDINHDNEIRGEKENIFKEMERSLTRLLRIHQSETRRDALTDALKAVETMQYVQHEDIIPFHLRCVEAVQSLLTDKPV